MPLLVYHNWAPARRLSSSVGDNRGHYSANSGHITLPDPDWRMPVWLLSYKIEKLKVGSL
jgi:hypothetical protein